jgi:Tol biopolymer transport system component/uncharacterized membrane protein
MDEIGTDPKPDAIQVTFEYSEYTIVPGTSVELVVFVANPSQRGDYFKASLLGIPSNWITYSGRSAVWVSAGGKEKLVLKVSPPAEDKSVIGSYPVRLLVVSQSAPEIEKELGALLTVLPEVKTRGAVLLQVESNEFLAIPGIELKIELQICNLSSEEEYLELSVKGAPPDWVSLPSPVISLLGDETKSVPILLHIPSTPEVRPGYYPLKICAVSQKDPGLHDEVEVKLGIAAFESQGRVGVVLRSVQFSAAPGGSLAIPLTLLNRGLVADAFRLGVEGIPVTWVSTSTAVSPVEPGENREVTLVVRPPLSPSSPAGRHKFRLVVASQGSPDQIVKVECTLTVTAYMQFSADLEPRQVEAGQPVTVTVKNEGNIQQVFHIACVSQDDELIFEFLEPEREKQDNESGDPSFLPIPAGETGAFRFSVRPRQRTLIGRAVTHPYYVTVESKGTAPAKLPGQVISRGMIPVWVLPVVLIACFLLAIASSFFLFQGRGQTNTGSQTSAAGTAVAAGATQTSAAGTSIAAGATQTVFAGTAAVAGVTQTIIANQTAAALVGQQDSDGDALTNQREAEIQTDPFNPDTDIDGLMDGEEVFQTGTNPLNADSDADGLKDGDEVRLRTNPLNADTDADSSRDGDEVRLGTNPLIPDTDSDGLIDGGETPPCPDPLNPDSDGDGLIDGRDLNPCDPANPALTATAVALLPTGTIPPPTAAPSLPPPTAIPTQPPTAAPTPQPTAVPPPRFRGVILFESDRDGNFEIYSESDSGQVLRLTNSPSADVQAAWGPRMDRIAFTSNRDGQNEIYIMNADGSGLVNLTNNPADDQQPTWSVDGAWIAFTSNRDGNYEIYVIDLSASQIRNLTNSPGNDTQPNWVRSNTADPSGEYIVFTSDRDGNQEIYRMKTDGSEPVNLTANPASDQMAKGSSDGVLLLYTTNRDGQNEIYSMRIDGNGAANLTNHPANDFGPAWSPDQSSIAYTSERTGNREVFITKSSVLEVHNLTNYAGQDQVSDWR